MKKCLFVITSFALMNGVFAGGSNTVSKNGVIQQEADQTDTLAIPLDNSEDEEAEEMKELERYQRNQKKPTYPSQQSNPHRH